jgi:hypothetical protein
MVDLDPRGLLWGAPAPAPPVAQPAIADAPPPLLQPTPNLLTTLRLLFTWHWASAGQHYTASRAREQARAPRRAVRFLRAPHNGVRACAALAGDARDRLPQVCATRDAHRSTPSHKRSCYIRGACCAPPVRCALADAAALRSTIYLLVIGTLAVTGIPSAGPDIHPPMWRRDVWAALWVVRLSRATQCVLLCAQALTRATAAVTDRLLPRRTGARWACICERTRYACCTPLMLWYCHRPLPPQVAVLSLYIFCAVNGCVLYRAMLAALHTCNIC